MTRLTGTLGIAAFVVCLFTIAFALFAKPSRQAPASPRPALFRALLLAFLVFAGLWMWLRAIVPLLAWAWWIGDNPHWFSDLSPKLTALVALTFAALVGYRVATNRATKRYAQIELCCSVMLLGLYGTAASYEFLRQIEGTDPRTAAQAVFNRHTDLVSEGALLVEQPSSDNDARCRTFCIMGKDEPRGRITVCQYHHFWWSYAGSERFRPSAEELQRAKAWLADPTNRYHAPLILRQIVQNYPGTKSATEAQALLDGLSHGDATNL